LQIVLDEMAPDSASRVAPRLSQMAALLEETIGAIREVMADLRPPVLDHHGLVSALHWYAPVFEARTGLRVRVAGPERGARLPRDVEISLFRIAQEALTNAAKHSGASLVQVRVDLSPARVELRVEDDGRGFRESRGARAARRGGWGLPAMRERAEAIGGRLSVETGGPGARIIVQVPLANADHGHPG
jgi:signal transduction histidine kinase